MFKDGTVSVTFTGDVPRVGDLLRFCEFNEMKLYIVRAVEWRIGRTSFDESLRSGAVITVSKAAW